MTKRFCDRCGSDCTGNENTAVLTINSMERKFIIPGVKKDLCLRCTKELHNLFIDKRS